MTALEQKYRDLLNSAHGKHCQWVDNPCREEFASLPTELSEIQQLIWDRRASLQQCPPLVISEKQSDWVRDQFQKEGSSHVDIIKASDCLALCGWTYENENEHEQMLVCDKCCRRVPVSGLLRSPSDAVLFSNQKSGPTKRVRLGHNALSTAHSTEGTSPSSNRHPRDLGSVENDSEDKEDDHDSHTLSFRIVIEDTSSGSIHTHPTTPLFKFITSADSSQYVEGECDWAEAKSQDERRAALRGGVEGNGGEDTGVSGTTRSIYSASPYCDPSTPPQAGLDEDETERRNMHVSPVFDAAGLKHNEGKRPFDPVEEHFSYCPYASSWSAILKAVSTLGLQDSNSAMEDRSHQEPDDDSVSRKAVSAVRGVLYMAESS